jgi:HAMP domain-containing protein
MTKTKQEILWNVQFVEDYAVTTTTVEAKDEDEAVEKAVKEMLDYYGRDFSQCSAEAEPA